MTTEQQLFGWIVLLFLVGAAFVLLEQVRSIIRRSNLPQPADVVVETARPDVEEVVVTSPEYKVVRFSLRREK